MKNIVVHLSVAVASSVIQILFSQLRTRCIGLIKSILLSFAAFLSAFTVANTVASTFCPVFADVS